MKVIKHKINHHYQPTNTSCGYTALAILLSHYDIKKTPEQLVKEVPQPKDDEGKPQGSVTAQLAEWCLDNNLKTHMYTSDLWVLDLAWQKLSEQEIVERLKIVGKHRDVRALGKQVTNMYIEAYVEMLEKGGKLTIVPMIKSKLIYKLLKDGPVYANICSTALRGRGRVSVKGLRKTTPDDQDGKVNTHSIVIYGNDEDGKFLVADPWDGLVVVDAESMVLAIEAAQIESDNQIFVLE